MTSIKMCASASFVLMMAEADVVGWEDAWEFWAAEEGSWCRPRKGESNPEVIVDIISWTQIERERQYLGGDAEHSVLVKGLDYALLKARKAELQRAKEGDVDIELDELAQGLRGQKETQSKQDPKREGEKLGNRVGY
jgi:hypothetical protein